MDMKLKSILENKYSQLKLPDIVIMKKSIRRKQLKKNLKKMMIRINKRRIFLLVDKFFNYLF